MTIVIDIENASGSDEVPDPSAMRRWIAAALASQARDTAELGVRIVDEEEITALNDQYRGKAYATNVLSFPAEIPDFVPIPLLGDIVICAPVVASEARDQGLSPTAHWAHMLVHGTLHLLGHDHLEDAEAEAMEALETAIITTLGFPPPYAGDDPDTIRDTRQ